MTNSGMMQEMPKQSTFIITQARVGSTRLPRKVLLDLTPGRTVLEHFLERCLNVRNAAGVIVATTDEPDACEIVKVCEKMCDPRVRVWRGPVDDVLARYHQATDHFGARVIVRLTSDCPLVDPALVDEMLAEFQSRLDSQSPLAYLANNNPPTFPHGLDTEIFTRAALDRSFAEAADPYEREHVTPYIRRHPEFFPLENFAQEENQASQRWTLDFPEDLEFFRAVFAELFQPGQDFSRHDVLELLRRRPELTAINAHRRQR